MYRRLKRRLSERYHRWFFDNETFWNARYRTDPVKGSGPGSRGPFADEKRQIIADSISRYGVASVLDLGCGDINILDGLQIPYYKGVDVSNVVIAQNRIKRPDWDFECGDIEAVVSEQSFDLVMCLDVLIHQQKKCVYRNMVKKIAALNPNIALVSGFEGRPRGWNVFFHEPLSISLRQAFPMGQIEAVADYRSTTLYRVLRNTRPPDSSE
jgi:2-polyprenyl-3-methyl-5-hydroxy-6-metoxy-1,4-benzoquinol methylase